MQILNVLVHIPSDSVDRIIKHFSKCYCVSLIVCRQTWLFSNIFILCPLDAWIFFNALAIAFLDSIADRRNRNIRERSPKIFSLPLFIDSDVPTLSSLLPLLLVEVENVTLLFAFLGIMSLATSDTSGSYHF